MALATERVNVIFDADASPMIAQLRAAGSESAKLQARLDAIKADAAADRNLMFASISDTFVDAGKRYLKMLADIGRATSDLIEQTNFAQKVFGDAFEGVEKFASAAANIGFSKTEALNAAAALGVFGKTAGLAGDELVQFTEELVTLAADMASIRNTQPEEAIIALAAAMRSEYEPLRRYGVVLNDVQLRQRAFALGIYDGTGALNSQQRILAARAEVMDQLSFAMGDFVSTQDQFANSQRKMNAELENAKAAIGQGVLPAMLGLVKVVNTLLGIFNTLPSEMQGAIGALAAFGAMALLVAGRVGQLVTGLNALNQIPAIATRLGPLITTLGSVFPAALAAAGVALAGLGIYAYTAKRATDELEKSVEELNRELAQTRGDEMAVLEGRLRSIAQNDWFEKLGLDSQQFIEDMKTGLSGTEQQFEDMREKWRLIFLNAQAKAPAEDMERILEFSDKTLESIDKQRASWVEFSALRRSAEREEKMAQLERNLQLEEERKKLQAIYEGLVRNAKAAKEAQDDSAQDVFKAELALLKAQTDAQKDLTDATQKYNEEIADRERALERQQATTERTVAAVADAQRQVQRAIQAEVDARQRIDDAIRDQVDAQEDLVDAQESAAEAQTEYARAVQETQKVLRGYGQASEEAAEALEQLDDSQRKVWGSQLALEDSSLALADAQTQLDRLRRFYGNTSSPSALRRLAEAERNVERAKLDHAEAVDDLEGSTKDLNEASDEYNWTVHGYPPESDRAKKAMEDQEKAADGLKDALKRVDDQQRSVVSSQRAVDEAYRGAQDAAREVVAANENVRRAAQEAQWAEDDLRRATWELASYRASGQPTMATEQVTAAEWALEAAKRASIQATYDQMLAEGQLNSFRASYPTFSPQTTPDWFRSPAPLPPQTLSIKVDLNNGLVTDPIALGKFIADNIERYAKAYGFLPPHGSLWR